MSYINEALRKAQRERDNRYEQFGSIIANRPNGADHYRKRRVTLFVAAALILLASTVLLLAVRVPHQPPLPKMVPQSSVAGTATQPAAAVQPEPKIMASSSSPAVQPSGGAQTVREADVRYQEALLAQRKRDLRRAEALYQKVLTVDPGHVHALNNLGVIYMAQKRREKAIAVLSRAVVLKKDYVDPYYNLACLYAQGNEISESLWYLKVATTIDSDVLNWVKKDADMKNVVASPEFKKIMEGQKN
jgi:tetratricopeptide (TPR) repeat protein